MKKIVLTLGLTLISGAASAQHHHHRGWYAAPQHYHYNWVAPAVIGGVVGYSIYRLNQPTQPVIVQQYPAPVQPPVVVQTVNCSAWVEIQQPDGTTVRQRTCTQ